LTEVIEARRLASDLHVQFTKAADASNRAVMADTDEGSIAAANEARRARQAVEQNVAAIVPVVQSLGYADEALILDQFRSCLENYRRIDDEILGLAVENSNLKAQRLSFGPAREAAAAFRDALQDAVESARPESWRARALAAEATSAVLEIEVLQAPHIAEAQDEPMKRMEDQMAASEAAARQALSQLEGVLPASAARHVASASAALDKLKSVNAEIVTLSRRNTDVRSLVLALGQKSKVTTECDSQLRALQDALAKHEFVATR
jgi:hypothetical protein